MDKEYTLDAAWLTALVGRSPYRDEWLTQASYLLSDGHPFASQHVESRDGGEADPFYGRACAVSEQACLVEAPAQKLARISEAGRAIVGHIELGSGVDS